MAPVHYLSMTFNAGSSFDAASVASEGVALPTEQVSITEQAPITEQFNTACSGFNCYDDGTKVGIIVTVVTVLLTIVFIIWYIGKESNRGQNTLEAWRHSFLYSSKSSSTRSSTVKCKSQVPPRASLTQITGDRATSQSQSRHRWYKIFGLEVRVVGKEPDSLSPPPTPVAKPQPVFISPGIVPQHPGAAMLPGQDWPWPPAPGCPPGPGFPPGLGMPPAPDMAYHPAPSMAYPASMPPMPATGQPSPQPGYYAPQPAGFQQHLQVPDPIPRGQAPPQPPPMAPHPQEPQEPTSPNDVKHAASSSNRGPSGGHRSPSGRQSWLGRLFRLPSPGHCSTIADPDSPCPPSTPATRQSSRGEGNANHSPSEVEWAVRRARIQEQDSGEDPEQTSTMLITRSRSDSLVVHRSRSQSRTRGSATRESGRDRQPRTYAYDEADDSDGTVRRTRAIARQASRRRPARPTSQANSRGQDQESEVEEYIIHAVSPSNGSPNVPLRSPSPARPNLLASPPVSLSTDPWSAEGTVGSSTQVEGEQWHGVNCGCQCHRRDSLGQL